MAGEVRVNPRVGLTFQERMSGPFAMGVRDPVDGARLGRHTRWRLTLHVTVAIDDARAFVAAPDRHAALTGEIELPGVRRRIPIHEGTFRLFPPKGVNDRTLMVYEFAFQHAGAGHFLVGRKSVRSSPVITRLWSDTTTLDVRLHQGTDAGGEVLGAGVLRIRATDLPRMMASVRTPNAGSPMRAGRAVGGYLRLFARSLAQAYSPRSR